MTGPPRRPRPLLEITGSGPLPAPGKDARLSHPGREEDRWSQGTAPNPSREVESFATIRIPRISSSLHVSGILSPSVGSSTQVPRKVHPKVGYILVCLEKELETPILGAQEAQRSPSSPQPTPRFPGLLSHYPAWGFNNAWTYLLP